MPKSQDILDTDTVPGCVDHGVDNTGDDDGLANQVTGLDQRFLDQRHLLRVHIEPEVPAAHDDAISLA